MTCIEKYNKQKNIATKIISNLNKAKGLTAFGEEDPRNNKYELNFYDHSICGDDIPLYFHASYGYYNACCPEMQKYLVKALNYYKYEIVNYMMEQAEKDKNDALLACKQEAESILKQIEEKTF